ncbi:MAG: molybdopterin dinucleotide-binding protein, partial [Eggerthellaceae bacterium]|nr:molybdopterin dinucleotide-binding protein [Eggerthellaceae bacterium]
NPNDASRLGLEQGDWVWIESPWGKVREVVDIYYGIKQGVVNANHAWWYPEFDTASHGFELVNINTIMNPYGQCPVGGCANMRSTPVLVYKATEENSPFNDPVPCDPDGVECIHDSSDERLKVWMDQGMRARVEGEEEWTGSVI